MTFGLFALVYLCISVNKRMVIFSQLDVDYLENSRESIFRGSREKRQNYRTPVFNSTVYVKITSLPTF